MHVLIVDQSDCTRSIIRSLLVALGLPGVAEATTGDEAIALAGRTPIDLVLADANAVCHEDGGAGTGFVEAFRAAYATTPIVLLTTRNEPVASHAGVAARLLKPFNHAELAAAINAASRPAQAG